MLEACLKPGEVRAQVVEGLRVSCSESKERTGQASPHCHASNQEINWDGDHSRATAQQKLYQTGQCKEFTSRSSCSRKTVHRCGPAPSGTYLCVGALYCNNSGAIAMPKHSERPHKSAHVRKTGACVPRMQMGRGLMLGQAWTQSSADRFNEHVDPTPRAIPVIGLWILQS